MESLMFLTEKSDGSKKGITCTTGRTRRSHVSKDEDSRPTASNKSMLLTVAVEVKEERDTMTLGEKIG